MALQLLYISNMAIDISYQMWFSQRVHVARNATAVIAKAILSVRLSVCLSVRPSVRHIPVFCPYE